MIAVETLDQWSALDIVLPFDFDRALREGLTRMEATQPSSDFYPGETPTEGRRAIMCWLALHDRAYDLRDALRPGDGVGEQQARRAIHSLFLYEHQLTATTRRKAREALWRRDRAETLPDFATRASWTRCRCGQCQPGQPKQLRLA